ncbi:hypothetical protein BDV18DRAFT_45295 [Aspergillus unguis]
MAREDGHNMATTAPLRYLSRADTCVLGYALDPMTRATMVPHPHPGTTINYLAWLRTVEIEPVQLTQGERTEVTRLFNEMFPLYWPIPPASFEAHVANLRLAIHKKCYQSWQMGYLEEVYQFFVELRPLVASFMPWEESLRTSWRNVRPTPPLNRAHVEELPAMRMNRSGATGTFVSQTDLIDEMVSMEVARREMNSLNDQNLHMADGTEENVREHREHQPAEPYERDPRASWTPEDQTRWQTFANWSRSKNPSARRKVQGDCMICFEPLKNSSGKTIPCQRDELKWCRAFCGVNFHSDCFNQWAWQVGTSQRGVTCPSCRRPWK